MKTPPLKEWRERVLNECPTKYRPTFERAYAGDSRSAGIRAFCLRCVGFVSNDARECTSWSCPLWPYRPYQSGDEE